MRRLLAALLVVALGGMTAPLAQARVAPPGEPDFVAVHPSGTGDNESNDPSRVVYTAELLSLTTGERIGTFNDVITCSTTAPPPCLVFDVVTTYRLPGGDIVNRGQWSGVPDPQRPGFLLIGTRPATDSIVGATGRFSGRTGRVLISGSIDMRKFPVEAPYEGLTMIRFNAKGASM